MTTYLTPAVLWPGRSSWPEVDEPAWRELVERLVLRLGGALGRVLSIDAPVLDVGDGFCVHLREHDASGPLPVRVRAVLGATPFPDGLYVEGCVFFYVGNERVAPAEQELLLLSLSPDLVFEVRGWEVGFDREEWAAFATFD